MAQLERPHRHVDGGSKSPATIQTVQQLLMAGEASKSKLSPSKSTSSPTSSPTSSSPSTPFFQRLRHHDSEEDHGQNQKKSVITKVKEKAKKLRHSLSKKRHEDWNASSPPSGAGTEGGGAEEDAEYHGAPMYESEKALEGYQEYARQHSRMSPRTPQRQYLSNNERLGLEQARSPHKHVLSNNEKLGLEQARSPPKHVLSNNEKLGLEQARSPQKNVLSNNEKLGLEQARSPQKVVLSNNEKLGLEQAREKTLNRPLSKKTTQSAAAGAAAATTLSGPSKIMTKPVAEKNQTPAYAEGSGTAQYITSKMQDLSVSKPGEHHSSSPSAATTHKPASLSIRPSRTPPAKMPSQTGQSNHRAPSNPSGTPPSQPSSAPPVVSNTSPTSQIWDKGVSVKEYLMNKFEPGEDDRALSKVISEAMSPRRTPGDVGVIEKVREAVTSLLRTEEPTKPADTNTTNATHSPSQVSASTSTSRAPSQVSASTSTTRAPSQVSASTNTTRAPSQVSASTSTTRAPSQVSASNSITRAPSRIPVSFNPQEVVHEENQGRILQEN